MIGIPIASLIGGVGTPAGSSINVLGMYFIEEYGKVRVSFLAWSAIGLPMVLVLTPVAWWVLLRFFPPEIATIPGGQDLEAERQRRGRLSGPEIKLLLVLAVMVTAWVASTWVRSLDVVVVALAGGVALFLPGVRLLTWAQAERSVGWASVLMIGGVTSLGAASVKTGLAKWLVESTLGGLAGGSPALVVAAVSAFAVVAHLPIPIAPVINTVLIPPIVVMAQATGQNPALLALPVAFTASCAFLLPLDAVPLVTYPRGYYRMIDMLVPGAVISAAWVALLTLLVVGLGPLLRLW